MLAGAGQRREDGSASTARFTLPDEPRYRIRRRSARGLGVEQARLEQVEEGPSRIDAREHVPGGDLLAAVEHHAGRSAVATSMRATGASVRISAPASRAALAIASLTPPVPPSGMPQARNAPSISPM